jgi:hypothetical protein
VRFDILVASVTRVSYHPSVDRRKKRIRNDRKINEKERQTEKIVVETALGGKEKERKKVE